MPGLSGVIQTPKSDHWLLGSLTYQYKGYLVNCSTVSPGHVRTSLISIFIAFLNKSRQADVVRITIYLKSLFIDRETNRQSSTGSNVGLVLWGNAEAGSDADNLPLLLIIKSSIRRCINFFLGRAYCRNWFKQIGSMTLVVRMLMKSALNPIVSSMRSFWRMKAKWKY